MAKSKNSRATVSRKIAEMRDSLETCIKELYKLDPVAGQGAALYCIIRLQQLIVQLQDGQH